MFPVLRRIPSSRGDHGYSRRQKGRLACSFGHDKVSCPHGQMQLERIGQDTLGNMKDGITRISAGPFVWPSPGCIAVSSLAMVNRLAVLPTSSPCPPADRYSTHGRLDHPLPPSDGTAHPHSPKAHYDLPPGHTLQALLTPLTPLFALMSPLIPRSSQYY